MSLPKVQQNEKQEFSNAAFISDQFLTLHSVREMVLIIVFLRQILAYYD